MIKIDGVDIPRIEYIDPVDGKVSILRVMQDGAQIWPTIPDVINTPTGIQLSEYEIAESIEWDYTKMYIGEGDNVNLVTLYFTGQDADVTSVPAITDWVLDPFNVVNTVTVYTDRVELLVNTPFTSASSVTISYSPGVNPLKDINGYLLTELNDQALENLVVPSYTYLLDEYPGAVAAYSLQRLTSSYLDCCLVRRDSDNAITPLRMYDDPTKSVDLLSEVGAGGTLGDWVGSGSAYIYTWYDQSGSNNNQSQTTEGQQPVLVESGVLVVSNNGKTGIRTYNSRLDHLGTAISVGNMDVYSGFHINEALSRVEQAVVSISDSTTNNRYISMCYQKAADTFAIIDRQLSNFQVNTTPPADLNTSFLQTGIKISLYNRYLWVNSSYIGVASGQLSSANSSNLYINRLRTQDVLCGDAIYQESIIYMSDQTDNRIDIEANINSRYNIYLTTSEVDAQLIQADNDGLSDTVLEINGVRSSTSDTAVANLISRNNTVITN